MGFREWLRRLLEERMFGNQEQLAERVGITQSSISNYLTGARRPDMERCILISEATDIPLADIVEMVRKDARDKAAQTAA
jgi:transcriptional regulator with XRE-family HTH domain